MSESNDTLDTTLPLGTMQLTPTGKRMGPLTFTANSKVDPTKHRSHSLSSTRPFDDADYSEEVVINYDAIRRSIVEASNIVFRWVRTVMDTLYCEVVTRCTN